MAVEVCFSIFDEGVVLVSGDGVEKEGGFGGVLDGIL